MSITFSSYSAWPSDRESRALLSDASFLAASAEALQCAHLPLSKHVSYLDKLLCCARSSHCITGAFDMALRHPDLQRTSVKVKCSSVF
jgi:hypothetical protein